MKALRLFVHSRNTRVRLVRVENDLSLITLMHIFCYRSATTNTTPGRNLRDRPLHPPQCWGPCQSFCRRSLDERIAPRPFPVQQAGWVVPVAIGGSRQGR